MARKTNEGGDGQSDRILDKDGRCPASEADGSNPTAADDPGEQLVAPPLIISEAIDHDTVVTVTDYLLRLNPDDDRPIAVIVNSPGGIVDCGLAIYDLLTTHQLPVITLAYGAANSVAAIILQAGDRRMMSPNAAIHLHNAFAFIEAEVDQEQLKRMLQQMRRTQRRLETIVAKRSGNRLALVRQWCHDEKRFTAKEAVACGLADGIVRKRRRRP